MTIDSESLLENAIRDGVRDAITAKFTGYNSPIEKLIEESVKRNESSIRTLLDEGIASCTGDAEFREEIKAAVRKTMAKSLIARFGGEVEKQVNVLKSDPTTRARIILAIDEIVKSKTEQ